MLSINQVSSVATWELSLDTSPNFQWFSVRTVLKVMGKAADTRRWPVTVDISDVRIIKIGQKRAEEEQLLRKKEEEEKVKSGQEEDMTVRLFHEVLD